MTAVRTFDFPPATRLWEAMPVIVAALDDEGLRLTDGPAVTSVLVDGVKRVIVPMHRISDTPAPVRATLDTNGMSVDDFAIAFVQAALAAREAKS